MLRIGKGYLTIREHRKLGCLESALLRYRNNADNGVQSATVLPRLASSESLTGRLEVPGADGFIGAGIALLR